MREWLLAPHTKETEVPRRLLLLIGLLLLPVSVNAFDLDRRAEWPQGPFLGRFSFGASLYDNVPVQLNRPHGKPAITTSNVALQYQLFGDKNFRGDFYHLVSLETHEDVPDATFFNFTLRLRMFEDLFTADVGQERKLNIGTDHPERGLKATFIGGCTSIVRVLTEVHFPKNLKLQWCSYYYFTNANDGSEQIRKKDDTFGESGLIVQHRVGRFELDFRPFGRFGEKSIEGFRSFASLGYDISDLFRPAANGVIPKVELYMKTNHGGVRDEYEGGIRFKLEYRTHPRQ